jgi:aryl-alcohol dehydrogenase-like predicted oxidoreductase
METEQTTPKAIYRQLGKSGLRVSVPILGAMGIGDKRYQPWVLEEDDALPLLKAAYDRGINTWDTSCSYSHGVSEIILGKAVKKYGIPRQKLVILTKCCKPVLESHYKEALTLKNLETNADYVNQFGLSRQSIFANVDASLRRLRMDYIDLLQIHRFDNTVPIEETMKTLHDLVESGKVRYIGASSMFAYQFVMMQSCAEKNGWTKFISMQNHYSLLYREEEREMNKYCNITGVGIIPWGPLNTGMLARPARDQGTVRANGKKIEDRDAVIIDRVEEIAEKRGWKMSQVALAWIAQRVSSPIGGFSSVERMDEALAAMQMKLTEQEEKYLEELYAPKWIKGHSLF